MLIDRRLILAAAAVLLAGCAGQPKPPPTPPGAYSGRSVLDTAIAYAGGEAALRKVQELYWTGSATVQAGAQSTAISVETTVRPFTYARSTSWPKDKDRTAAKTMDLEFGSGWNVTGVSWVPMPEAQVAHEKQQFALYGVMLLVGLKDAGVIVQETAPGKDGTRNLHVEHPNAPAMDLRFNADGKLIRVADSVRDPDGGSALIPQVITFDGEIVSNGVKWPKKITIQQRDAPYFDLELATFEARPAIKVGG
jgi:hypothetical protein